MSMEARFQPAEAAVMNGDLDTLEELLAADPGLATDPSSQSHPTLLQCAVLAHECPNNLAIVERIIAAGAPLDDSLRAAAGPDNADAVAALLAAGANMERDDWSPLEEALYFCSERSLALLVEKGAAVDNLRKAAGLGRLDLVRGFFDGNGRLKQEAKGVNWPFGDVLGAIGAQRQEDIVNHALCYAAMHGHVEVADYLLEQGADINGVPPGFDYQGAPLHYAALRGQLAMVKHLYTKGANIALKDGQMGRAPEEWAVHSGHTEVEEYLRGLLEQEAAAPRDN